MKRLLPIFIAAVALVSSAAAAFAQAVPPHEHSIVFARETDTISNYYRIPALAVAKNGNIIAAADARGNQLADLPQVISVVVRVSHDNGRTWGPIKMIAKGEKKGEITYGDPALVTDPADGTIYLFYSGDNGFGASTKEHPIRLFMSKSTDNGETWTAPTDLTEKIWQPDWVAAFFTSGAALATTDGRIMIVPVVRLQGKRGAYDYAAWTNDGGETWHTGTETATPAGNGNEAKLMELADGRLLMSLRSPAHRMFATSADGGNTWSQLDSVPELVEPGCNGDIIRYNAPSGKSYLLHSIPNTTEERKDKGTQRENVSIFVSDDEGATWKKHYTVVRPESSYSAMTVLPDGSIGILVEEGWWEGWVEGGAINANNPGFNLVFHRLTPEMLGLE